VVQSLHALGIHVQTPVTVHVDNMGAIFVARMPPAIKGHVTLMQNAGSQVTLLKKASLMWCSQTWQTTCLLALARM